MHIEALLVISNLRKKTTTHKKRIEVPLMDEEFVWRQPLNSKLLKMLIGKSGFVYCDNGVHSAVYCRCKDVSVLVIIWHYLDEGLVPGNERFGKSRFHACYSVMGLLCAQVETWAHEIALYLLKNSLRPPRLVHSRVLCNPQEQIAEGYRQDRTRIEDRREFID